MRPGEVFDLAVVGAGISGLAPAMAAARRGKRVVVLDRDAQANGASVRNVGFVTVTGRQAGACWARAMRSRDIWVEVAEAAGIPILQRGPLTVARRPEARDVLEEFMATDMARGCRLIEPHGLDEFGQGRRRIASRARPSVHTKRRSSRSRPFPDWLRISPSAAALCFCARRRCSRLHRPGSKRAADRSRLRLWWSARATISTRCTPTGSRRMGSPVASST